MKPKFEDIEPCACKCESIEQRDEILRQLKEWGVKVYELYDEQELIVWWNRDVLVTLINDYENTPFVSPSDFLSKFREVYEASINNAIEEMHKQPLVLAAKEIVLPSDNIWEERMGQIFDDTEFGGIQHTTGFSDFVSNIKQRIKELNR